MCCKSWLAALLLVPALAVASPKVLYVTHEPGRWHDYSAQLASMQQLATQEGWSLTVATGDAAEAHAFLRTPEFARNHDAVVYNLCFAASRDLEAMTNLIAQTEILGVPAVLVHCAMHSWWGTFKAGQAIPGNTLGKARADRKLLAEWQETGNTTPLPAWGDFSGVASTKHGRKKPIQLSAVAIHPITIDLPANYQTSKTELYNNHYLTPDVQPLLIGKQGRDEAIVMWLAPRGAGQVLGLTLGHDQAEWEDPVFLKLLANGINFLTGSASTVK
ncbi:MAG: ThuA domain-containing protein [Pseudomonadota bacterium]